MSDGPTGRGYRLSAYRSPKQALLRAIDTSQTPNRPGGKRSAESWKRWGAEDWRL